MSTTPSGCLLTATLLTPPATGELPVGATDAEPCPACGTAALSILYLGA